MPKFQITLADATYEALAHIALQERRPPRWQAEVMLTDAVRAWVEKRAMYHTPPTPVEVDAAFDAAQTAHPVPQE